MTFLGFPGGMRVASELEILGILDEEACLEDAGVGLPDFNVEAALPVFDAALI